MCVVAVRQSRTHHETGFRHKGNLERYIRGIYKKGNLQERAKAEEAREIASIDAAAAAAMGISAAQASTSGTSGPSASFRKRSAPTGDAYSSAASLGFVDHDAERLKAEKELREKEGYMGEWNIVDTAQGSRETPQEDLAEEEEEQPAEAAESEGKHAARELEASDLTRVSHSYLKERTLPTLDDDEYDKVQIKVRKPKVTPAQQDALAKAREQARLQAPPGTLGPRALEDAKKKFRAVEASDHEETPEEAERRMQSAWDLIQPKDESDTGTGNDHAVATTPSDSLFKKRKAKSSDSAAKRRAG